MSNPIKRLVVLVSGGGTNLQAVLDAIDRGEINGKVVAVIASNAQAYALQRAQSRGIATRVCALADYGTRERRDEKLLELLNGYAPDYILLAGYLGIVSPHIVQAYQNRIVNIHPALLPKYGGKNYYGLNVHRAVLAAHEAVSGATVHFVDNGTDTGLIIAQKSVAVSPDDTPESLQQKILEYVEHRLFPAVVRELCAGNITVRDGAVRFAKEDMTW